MTSIFLHHLKLEGKAKELVQDRIRIAKERAEKSRKFLDEMKTKAADAKANSQGSVNSMNFNQE